MSDNLRKNIKADSRARSVMSFLLFVFITLLSVSLCAKSLLVNVDFIKKQFVSFNYVSSLNENINEYISDEFIKNGISDENIDKLITYSFCEELIEQYISGQIDSKSSFTAQSVEQSIDDIKDNLILEIKEQVKNADLKYNKEACEKIADNICSYIKDQISITGIERVKAVLNVAGVALTVGIIVLLVFVAVFCAITFFIGRVRYRSVRAMAIGCLSSGVFQLFIPIVVYTVFNLKHIDIYPMYLREALMSYIYGSAQAMAFFGVGLIIISFVLSTLVWRMKKKRLKGGTLMDKDVAISVQDVTMSFVLNKEKVDNLKEYMIKLITHKLEYNKFYALKNINFEVKKGEHLAIMGLNGAGKSTLLKTIVGVYKPSEGKVKKCGVIAPLLELGAGFDGNYSGKENIYLYGAILGYDREYISSKFDEIVEFSELGDFINVPVKNYSSGMKARLGFSIATAVEPDILILDEVLSVGDAGFKKKSLAKVKSLFAKGVTVLFVSHSVEQVKAICDKAILLEHGQIIASGDVMDVISVYEEKAHKKPAKKPAPKAEKKAEEKGENKEKKQESDKK